MTTIEQRVAQLRRLLQAEKRRDRISKVFRWDTSPHLGICVVCEAVHESPTRWADGELTDCGRCGSSHTVARP